MAHCSTNSTINRINATTNENTQKLKENNQQIGINKNCTNETNKIEITDHVCSELTVALLYALLLFTLYFSYQMLDCIAVKLIVCLLPIWNLYFC